MQQNQKSLLSENLPSNPTDTYHIKCRTGAIPGPTLSRILTEINTAYGLAFLALDKRLTSVDPRLEDSFYYRIYLDYYKKNMLSDLENSLLESMGYRLSDIDYDRGTLLDLYRLKELLSLEFRSDREPPFDSAIKYYAPYTNAQFCYVQRIEKGSLVVTVMAGISLWIVMNTVGQSFKESYKNSAMDRYVCDILRTDLTKLMRASRKMVQIGVAKAILAANFTLQETSLSVTTHENAKTEMLIKD